MAIHTLSREVWNNNIMWPTWQDKVASIENFKGTGRNLQRQTKLDLWLQRPGRPLLFIKPLMNTSDGYIRIKYINGGLCNWTHDKIDMKLSNWKGVFCVKSFLKESVNITLRLTCYLTVTHLHIQWGTLALLFSWNEVSVFVLHHVLLSLWLRKAPLSHQPDAHVVCLLWTVCFWSFYNGNSCLCGKKQNSLRAASSQKQ